MSKILEHVKDVVDALAVSEAPVHEDGATPRPSYLSREIVSIQERIIRGPGFTPDDLPAYIDAAKNLNGPGLDDRQFLLEKLLTLMARSPDNSALAQKLEKKVIQILYKDLPHPPSGYLTVPRAPASAATEAGAKVKYAFRSADGSDYNALLPTLGMAGMPYARSVPSANRLPPQYLPDPGLVFDTLLKRDEFVEHPAGLNAFFFAFANIVIHCIFNTSPRDWTVNDASSYLDLSPLYGSSEAEVDSVRRKDGTGRLWDDVFADRRLLFMPPATSALLVLFCRNHNYIAKQILALNERGTFVDSKKLEGMQLVAQDDEIFARARLVNTAYFIQVILGDYVGGILGLTRDGLGWRLDPLATMRETGHEFAPRGEGNVVSVEFNLMYRWHATTSRADTAWIEELFGEIFEGKSGDEVTAEDFKKGVIKLMIDAPREPKNRVFDKLKRGSDGRFADADLAKIIFDATEAPAGAFKARGIPEMLRVIEVLGILQSRSWGTCSLNEFRSFIGLRPYETFKEWNPDPKIYMAAESLYHDIDNLELHVGLQAEETKLPMPGAGLCPGYTVSRAILADAVCLTRGDRFLTVDCTPFNMTAWGYQYVQYDLKDGSFGGMLHKMLYRTLGEWYPAGSAYAIFPFVVPTRMREYVKAMPEVDERRYGWSRPTGPGRAGGMGSNGSAGRALNVNVNGINGAASPAGRVQDLLRDMLPDVSSVERVLYGGDVTDQYAGALGVIAQSLIATHSIEHVGSKAKYLNVVRDVINVVPVLWIADNIIGLPLKTEINPRGIYRPQELVELFRSTSSYVYDEVLPSKAIEMRERAARTADLLTKYLKAHLAEMNGASLNGLADHVVQSEIGRNEHQRAFLCALQSSGHGSTRGALAAGVFEELVPTAMAFARALCVVVDYYLSEDRATRLVRVLVDAPGAAFDKVIDEALDVSQWKHAEAFTSGLMHPKLFVKVAYHVLQTIFSLPNIRRAPGSSGALRKILDPEDASKTCYLNVNAEITTWPVSLIIEYDVMSM